MATPLNTFKTVTAVLGVTNSVIYTAPSGITSIVLMAQVANTANDAASVTFSHLSNDSTSTELIKGYTIPVNDAASVITGKLILEEGSSVTAFASHNNRLKLTLSILESVNA